MAPHPAPHAPPVVLLQFRGGGKAGDGVSGSQTGNNTVTIIIAVVVSVVGAAIIGLGVAYYRRWKSRKPPLKVRGVTIQSHACA